MPDPSEEIRVLHVEDEPDFADIATDLIEQQDDRITVTTVFSAAEGRELLAESSFDCVVSNYEMPGESGLELLEAVREDSPDLPFILYTGKGSEEVASEAISAGVTDYLQKESGTSQYDVLANRITNAVEQRRARVNAAETERRLQTIAENTNDILWQFTAEWDELLLINSPYEEIWNRSIQELREQPQSFLKGVHPADRAKVKAAMDQLTGGESVDIEFRVNAEENFQRWVWAQGDPVVDEAGTVESVVGFARDITDRKEREALLEKQQAETAQLQERLQHGLAATDTYVWDWDLETGEMERFPTPESLFDLQTEQIGPDLEDWLDHVHPEDRSAVQDTIDEAIESGSGFEFQCRFEVGDGSYQWIRDRAVVESEDGEPVRLLGTVTDVTEQVERERTLTRLVEELGNLIDTTTMSGACEVATTIAGDLLDAPLVGIHLLADDGDRLKSIAARDDVRDEFGVPPAYERESGDAAAELVWDVFGNGERIYLENIEEKPDLAEATPARSSVVHPLNSHGVLIASSTEPQAFDETDRAFMELLSQSLTAVLDRVKREEQLRQQNQQLEDLHTAGQEIIQADSHEEIADRVVAGAQSILNYPITLVRFYDESAEGLVAAAATDRVYEVLDSRPTFTADGSSLNWAVYASGSTAVYDDISGIDRAVDSDTPIRSLMILPLGDHGTVSVGSTAAGAFDEGDTSLAQLLATTAELSLSNLDREDELIEQRDELRRQNERLDEFASIVSHDLRSPLNVAQARLEMAAEECDSEFLDGVAETHDRMERLIDDLLSLASVGEGVGELDSLELSTIVRSCWHHVETDSAKLDIETDITVRADETRLRQLLENLLRNAVEHGGAEVIVSVGNHSDGFYVEDDGQGVPEPHREEVLEPGTSLGSGGTGFGLSIVRDVARAHGWDLTLTEGSAGGARFEFSGVETP